MKHITRIPNTNIVASFIGRTDPAYRLDIERVQDRYSVRSALLGNAPDLSLNAALMHVQRVRSECVRKDHIALIPRFDQTGLFAK